MLGSYGRHGLPSIATGNNIQQTDIFASNNNTQDSVLDNLGNYGTGNLSTPLSSVEDIYNTGNWELDTSIPTLIKLIYVGVKPLDVEISVAGNIISSASVNTNHLVTRLLSTSGIITGSLKTYKADKLTGGTSVAIGFDMSGFNRFNTGDSLVMEIAKDFIGDCIVQNIIIGLRRLI